MRILIPYKGRLVAGRIIEETKNSMIVSKEQVTTESDRVLVELSIGERIVMEKEEALRCEW